MKLKIAFKKFRFELHISKVLVFTILMLWV